MGVVLLLFLLAQVSPSFAIKASVSCDKTTGYVTLTWQIPEELGKVNRIEIRRSATPNGPFEVIASFTEPMSSFVDTSAKPNRTYYYKIVALKGKETIESAILSTSFRVNAMDTPNDAGFAVTLTWQLPPGIEKVNRVVIYRATSPDGPFEKIKTYMATVTRFEDMGLENGKAYYYKILIEKDGETYESLVSGPAIPKPQWFHKGRLPILIGVLLYTLILLYFILSAKRGKELYLRPIAGLKALDEAIGRATEMGRPILYVPGLSTISDVATIASINILSHVTRKIAEYETKIIVPNRNPVVYTVTREVVKEAFTSAGRPDLFDPDSVFYVTDSQFGYAAAVSGIMIREKTATNLFLGMFWAESLILAETGASTGAIQIAGTDAVTQLPFFITACDYTLIGEELYAASAYLSKEPILRATLKGQDMMKLILAIILILGSICGLLGKTWFLKIL